MSGKMDRSQSGGGGTGVQGSAFGAGKTRNDQSQCGNSAAHAHIKSRVGRLGREHLWRAAARLAR